jgi:hypothetical protein
MEHRFNVRANPRRPLCENYLTHGKITYRPAGKEPPEIGRFTGLAKSAIEAGPAAAGRVARRQVTQSGHAPLEIVAVQIIINGPYRRS